MEGGTLKALNATFASSYDCSHSHSCTVLSLLAEARRLPSGDQVTLSTTAVCPRSVYGKGKLSGGKVDVRNRVLRAITVPVSPSPAKPTPRPTSTVRRL